MSKTPLQEESLNETFARLRSSPKGLTSHEAHRRLKHYGPNSLKPPRKGKGIFLFLSQFKSPLILLLIGAALLSYFLRDKTDAIIIFTIVILSGLLGFFQELGALSALEKLLQLVENKALAIRDGKEREIPLPQVVPGDMVILQAGDLVPADCILIETTHFFVDEATLTGESCPAEKTTSDPIYLGTTVASGRASALAVVTGQSTKYSEIYERIRTRPPETAFEVGVRKFGYFLLEVTFILVIAIFAFNIFLKKPVIDSFLFSLALAVGLTPQLLPAIITVNLSHGARRMAKRQVVIKRLASIENFGQMDVLCADKTGTLTVGKVELNHTANFEGKESEKSALYGFLNAHFQTGYSNPLDQAILQKSSFDISQWKKIDETPYDFIRKRLSVVLEHQGRQILIAKGALPQMLSICNRVELSDGSLVPLPSYQNQIERYFEEQSQKGFRTLALAYGEGTQEENLVFLGFLIFHDPIKPDIAGVVAELKKKGVNLKIITGDHQSVALHVAAVLELTHASLITGPELRNIDDRALLKIVREKNLFAQIEPNQKERIILALRKSGHVVGFLGDGINDVSALHSADVGISVESGVDVAKEAADIVLLKKDLSVLAEGIDEGRSTFANTLKYVYMATSGNFGNMFSMAGASLFLSFLPLLPKQVLLTNFFSDFPEMALATDRVDRDIVRRPVKWNLPFIRRFMLVFGLLSSVADYMTFGILLYWFKTDDILFRTGWFVESVVSATLIVLVIRTRGPFWRSRPSWLLLFAVFTIVIGALVLPFTPIGTLFGFRPLPLSYYALLSGIIAFYMLSVEIGKRFFFKNGKTK